MQNLATALQDLMERRFTPPPIRLVGRDRSTAKARQSYALTLMRYGVPERKIISLIPVSRATLWKLRHGQISVPVAPAATADAVEQQVKINLLLRIDDIVEVAMRPETIQNAKFLDLINAMVILRRQVMLLDGEIMRCRRNGWQRTYA